MGMVYGMLRDATRAASKPVVSQPAQSTALATRRPDIVVKDKLNITPVDLNTEVPAVDSSLLLRYIAQTFAEYARFERPEDIIIITTWVASTWMVKPTAEQGMKNGQLMFGAHPRLFLIGEPSSGKNRVMKIIKELVRNPTPIAAGVVTSYGVRNAIEAGRTVIIDEYHKRIGTRGTANSELQQLVLAYSSDEGSIDGKNGAFNEHAILGPMVLAAQPQIEEGQVGQVVQDQLQRGFVIRMVEHTDPDDVIPDLDDAFYAKCKDLHDALELFAAGIYGTLGSSRRTYSPIHSVPKALGSQARMREISLPLLFVADVAVNPDTVAAEGNDLEWAEMTRNAVQMLLLGHGPAVAIMDRLRNQFGDKPSGRHAK